MQKGTVLRISTLVALSAMASVAASAFPLSVGMENNSWRPAVEPETSTLIEAYKTADVVVRDADQLVRVMSNIEQLNAIAQWPEGVGLALVFPVAEPAATENTGVAASDAAAAVAASESGPPEPAIKPAIKPAIEPAAEPVQAPAAAGKRGAK